MKEPSLKEFDLTENLVEKAQQIQNEEHRKRQRVSNFLSMALAFGWMLIWILLGLFWGLIFASIEFGPIQWAVLVFFVGIFSIGFFIEWVPQALMAYWFPWRRPYAPILDRFSKFQRAQF